jgi:hypothetical protein
MQRTSCLVLRCRPGWRFNDAAWLTNAATQPLFYEAETVAGWSGSALRMAGTGASLLAVPEVAMNGKTNLPATATIRFWFAPDWTSAGAGGSGPGAEVRLLETGAWSAQEATARCALIVDADGDTLRLEAPGGGGVPTVLSAGLEWLAGEWHQIALAVSAQGTILFLDGLPAATGNSVTLLPSPATGSTNGFALGSDVKGDSLAQGSFDELATFARLLTTNEMARDYAQNRALAALGTITPETLMSFSSGIAPGFGNTNGTNHKAGGAPPLALDPNGCALWLSIRGGTNHANVTNTGTATNLVLRLHNTLPGTNYVIWSRTNIVATNWVTETNVIGATSQDWTEITIPTLGRSNLFFTASVTRSYVLNSNFAGASYTNNYQIIADTMGAVGPHHFVELLNDTITVFSKTNGAKLEQLNVEEFFRPQDLFGTNRGLADPRIVFDHQSQCWVASIIEFHSFNVILAVCTNSNPISLTNWNRYPLYITQFNTDYQTLGLDGNGIYVTALHRFPHTNFVHTNSGHTVVAIKKPEIYQGTLLTNTFRFTASNDLRIWTIQPPVNHVQVATNGYAWLVAKGPPQLGSGTNYRGGAVLYRRLRWTNSTAILVDDTWKQVTDAVPALDYRDYFDIEGTNQVFTYLGPTLEASQAGGSKKIDLAITGSRLMNALIRNGFLYTCHQIGLNGTNGSYAGG